MSKSNIPRVVIEKILPATPADVYVAWTEPEHLRAFMCPGDTIVTHVEADVRVGGRFKIVMRDGERDLEHHGEYRIIEGPRRLVFTWNSPVTGSQPTLVTIELSPHQDGTRLVLIHEPLPSEDSAARHKRGWSSILDKLAQQLAARPAQPEDPHFSLTLEFPASAARLYAQFATAAGVRNWWTHFCEMTEDVGGRASFRFPNNGFSAGVRIAILDPPRLVEWDVIEQNHPESTGFIDLNDWVGTHIRFEIEPIDTGHSGLHFTHQGLVLLECGNLCSSAWSFFLGQSLRAYLETGTGHPATA
jgi:uncharacterized protein YndB with AHSA1/START domain